MLDLLNKILFINNISTLETQPRSLGQSHHNPLLNIDRDMENRAAAERRRINLNAPHNLNPRDRLFHALFMKIGHLYIRVVPKNLQLLIELVVLLKVFKVQIFVVILLNCVAGSLFSVFSPFYLFDQNSI